MKNKEGIKLKLIDLTTLKIFYKEFETEFERDKYLRRLKFFKNIKLINSYKNSWED